VEVPRGTTPGYRGETPARAKAIAEGKEPTRAWSPIPKDASEAYQLRWTAGDDAAERMFIPSAGAQIYAQYDPITKTWKPAR
jgi:hypothetical protein